MASGEVGAWSELCLRCAGEGIHRLLKAVTLRYVAIQLALLVSDYFNALALGRDVIVHDSTLLS